MKKRARELKDYYLTKEFEDKYNYKGELGVSLSAAGTVFKLWSPVAEKVILRLFENGTEGEAEAIFPMEKTAGGVWEYKTYKKLSGKYYDYVLIIEGKESISSDPYAKACGINGIRSMVIDLNETNPKEWENDKAPEREAEDIIYELHVKEFSYAEESG